MDREILKNRIRKFPFVFAIVKIPLTIIRLSRFARDYIIFRESSSNTSQRFQLQWKDRHPCLDDKTIKTGFDRHYIYHPAWAARILAEVQPEFHVDISSSLYFCSIVSAFVPVRFYDYRPADLTLSNLMCASANLFALPFPNNSIASLSCMHVVEHVGLGRYGDPLDPDGDLKAIAELKRVLATGGSLLFVVPIGQPRVMFNAHRIYSYEQIVGYFEGLKLVEFSLIPDDPADGGLIRNASRELADAQTYGCGCFWFKRESC